MREKSDLFKITAVCIQQKQQQNPEYVSHDLNVHTVQATINTCHLNQEKESIITHLTRTT